MFFTDQLKKKKNPTRPSGIPVGKITSLASWHAAKHFPRNKRFLAKEEQPKSQRMPIVTT